MALEASLVTGGPLAQMRGLRAALTKYAPEIVHLHLPSPVTLAVLAPPRHFGLIAHLHTRPVLAVHRPTPARRLTALAQSILHSQCDGLIAISNWVANAWRTSDPRLAPSVVHNGVNLPAQPGTPRPAGPFTVGMGSRLSGRKGVEEFLDLAAAVHAQAPDIIFRIAGDGPRRAHYEACAADLGLTKVVTFEGFVADMTGFWRRLDLAAFTSPFEPFGLRLVEPVAAGTPVVAYRTGTGADEVIDHCRGVTAVPYDEPAALAQRILSLREASAERTRMAIEGRQDIARSFETGVMAAGVAGVYHEALARHGVTARA